MIDPQTAFVLGALIASIKGIGLVAVGAGIAWWRARRRVRELEGQLAAAAVAIAIAIEAPAMGELERGLEYLTAQIQALAQQQQELARRLPSSTAADGSLR